MLFYNGKPHCFFSQLLFCCQVYARKTICLSVLSVYMCQNNEQIHVTVDTLPMWYLAHVKKKPVIRLRSSQAKNLCTLDELLIRRKWSQLRFYAFAVVKAPSNIVYRVEEFKVWIT